MSLLLAPHQEEKKGGGLDAFFSAKSKLMAFDGQALLQSSHINDVETFSKCSYIVGQGFGTFGSG